MTKNEYAARIAGKFNELTKGDILDILDAMTEVTVEALGEVGDREPIPVLPKALKVYKHWTPAKDARMGVNPRTGERMELAPKPAAWKIKAGVLKRLREADVAAPTT